MSDQPAGFILMYLALPLWIAAGLADWHFHRRTRIAVTSGLPENLLHWLMYAQVGVAMAVVVWFELNAAVLAVVTGVFLLHEVTVYADLQYSTLRRDVGPGEQMVHSFLELLPLLALALLALIAWPQALAAVRLGDDVPDWALRPREALLPLPYLAAALAATLVCNALPLAQETWSCIRARPPRARKAPAAPSSRAPAAPRPEGAQAPRQKPSHAAREEPRLEPRLDPAPGPTPAPKPRTPASPEPR